MYQLQCATHQQFGLGINTIIICIILPLVNYLQIVDSGRFQYSRRNNNNNRIGMQTHWNHTHANCDFVHLIFANECAIAAAIYYFDALLRFLPLPRSSSSPFLQLHAQETRRDALTTYTMKNTFYFIFFWTRHNVHRKSCDRPLLEQYAPMWTYEIIHFYLISHHLPVRHADQTIVWYIGAYRQ